MDAGQDAGYDAGQDALPVHAAAGRLGISPAAVRKRIRRHSLPAFQVDGEWRIVLPREDGAGRTAVAPGLDGVPRASTNGVAHDVPRVRPEEPRGTPVAPPPSALVQVLEDALHAARDEARFLRQELTARQHQLEQDAQERAELRRLLALALQTRALPAPSDTPTESGSRPWWTRWRWWR